MAGTEVSIIKNIVKSFEDWFEYLCGNKFKNTPSLWIFLGWPSPTHDNPLKLSFLQQSKQSIPTSSSVGFRHKTRNELTILNSTSHTKCINSTYNITTSTSKKRRIQLKWISQCTPENQFQNYVFWFSVSLNEIYGKKIIETQFT